MHEEVVQRRGWIGERRFFNALNYCMLLPGPEAQQLATYLGWLLHGTRGAIAAGLLFVLPSALLLWALAWAYMTWGSAASFQNVLAGLKSAVLALVILAVVRISRKALRHRIHWILAVASFAVSVSGWVPFPVVILIAGLVGFWCRTALRVTQIDDPTDPSSQSTDAPPSGEGSSRRVWVTLMWGGVIWLAPVLVAMGVLGRDHLVAQMAVFFSKTSLITFGGAYAVIPYVAESATGSGWISQTQMMDAMAFAETTPGPLVMVLQFVGFVGAWQAPDPFTPLTAGTLAALITSWATFVPSFVWILCGAPFVERLSRLDWASAMLSGVTAAVSGVILQLALWFASGVLWSESSGVRWLPAVLAAACGVAFAKRAAPAPWIIIAAGVTSALAIPLLR